MSHTGDELCKCLEKATKIKGEIPSKEKARKTANRMKLLAHPTRLQILKILSQEPVCVCVIAKIIGKNQPNISQHLAKLRDNRIIEDYHRGKLIFYRIKDREILKLIDNI